MFCRFVELGQNPYLLCFIVFFCAQRLVIPTLKQKTQMFRRSLSKFLFISTSKTILENLGVFALFSSYKILSMLAPESHKPIRASGTVQATETACQK
jgi:hypothetical protein